MAIVSALDDPGTTGQEELHASACGCKDNIGYKERVQECFKYTDIDNRNESLKRIFKTSLAPCLVTWG
jgi:hypothetical protein